MSYPRENLYRFGFAHPRNYGSFHARNDWIFHVDTDELIDLEQLRQFAAMNAPTTPAMCVRRRNYHLDARFSLDAPEQLLAEGAFHEEGQCRIYRVHPNTHWSGLVHEEVMYGDDTGAENATESGLVLHHLNAFKRVDELE